MPTYACNENCYMEPECPSRQGAPGFIVGQVRLVRSVRLIRLKTDNFRLHDEQTVNVLRENFPGLQFSV
jgi:hypothetical protein